MRVLTRYIYPKTDNIPLLILFMSAFGLQCFGWGHSANWRHHWKRLDLDCICVKGERQSRMAQLARACAADGESPGKIERVSGNGWAVVMLLF